MSRLIFLAGVKWSCLRINEPALPSQDRMMGCKGEIGGMERAGASRNGRTRVRGWVLPPSSFYTWCWIYGLNPIENPGYFFAPQRVAILWRAWPRGVVLTSDFLQGPAGAAPDFLRGVDRKGLRRPHTLERCQRPDIRSTHVES